MKPCFYIFSFINVFVPTSHKLFLFIHLVTPCFYPSHSLFKPFINLFIFSLPFYPSLLKSRLIPFFHALFPFIHLLTPFFKFFQLLFLHLFPSLSDLCFSFPFHFFIFHSFHLLFFYPSFYFLLAAPIIFILPYPIFLSPQRFVLLLLLLSPHCDFLPPSFPSAHLPSSTPPIIFSLSLSILPHSITFFFYSAPPFTSFTCCFGLAAVVDRLG